MHLKITVAIAAFSLNGVAEHLVIDRVEPQIIDRLEREIDYVDVKSEETIARGDQELGVIPTSFQQRELQNLVVDHQK